MSHIVNISAIQPYDPERMRADGDAENMLFARYNFPDQWVFNQDEVYLEYSDRLQHRNPKQYEKVINKYGASFDIGLWLLNHQRDTDKVMGFLKELMNSSNKLNLDNVSGYLVLGSLNFAYKTPYYCIELFENNSGAEVKTEYVDQYVRMVRFFEDEE